jgi:hypothetical protein
VDRPRALTGAEVTTLVVEDAARIDPPLLRTLVAIDLAGALDLGDDLDPLVTYDDRLAEVAAANGVTTVSPA